jgi:hypothetical protein
VVPGKVYLPKGSVLEVVDFKYGAGTVVEVEGNTQGLYYAIGATLATQRKADKVVVTIVQPRAPHRDGIVRSYEITWDELVAFREELLSGAVATQQDDAPLFAGDHCKFCPALAVCPAQAELAQSAAKATFSQLLPDVYSQPGIGGDDIYPPEVVLPAPTTLTLSDLVEVMEAAPVITDWLKAVQAEVRDMTERGDETGYKLVAKRGTRKWKNETEAEQVLRDRLGDDEAFTSKLLSVTQAEKALARSDALIAGPLPEELWAMVSSGTNLVPNSDGREAIAALPTPQEVFEPTTVIRAEDIHVEPEVVEVEYEDGTRVRRLVSEDGVETLEVNTFAVEYVPETEPPALAPHEVEYEPATAIAPSLEAIDPNFEGVEITEPIEAELVEYSVAADEYTPNTEYAISLWRVQTYGEKDFYVEAPTKSEARAAARRELGVDRLPNHTVVSQS